MRSKQAKIIRKILKAKNIDINSVEGRNTYKEVKRYVTNNKTKDKLADKTETEA